MKKSILTVALLAGVGIMHMASAAPLTQNTGFQGSGEVTTANCKLLANEVTLNLSSNVWGSYACDEATSVITVGACHAGGSRKPKTVNCTVDPSDNTKFLPAGCTDATGTVSISDFTGYVAGSNGGSVGEKELGGACNGTTAQTLTN